MSRSRRRIKGASYAAFSVAVLLAIGLLIIAWEHQSVDPLVFLADPFLLAGLGYGVWKNSRVCAIALLVYWVVLRPAMYSDGPPVSYLFFFLMLAITYLFFSGVIGTIFLHWQKRKAARFNQQSRPKS